MLKILKKLLKTAYKKAGDSNIEGLRQPENITDTIKSAEMMQHRLEKNS